MNPQEAHPGDSVTVSGDNCSDESLAASEITVTHKASDDYKVLTADLSEDEDGSWSTEWEIPSVFEGSTYVIDATCTLYTDSYEYAPVTVTILSDSGGSDVDDGNGSDLDDGNASGVEDDKDEKGSLELNTTTVAAGGTLYIKAEGFNANETVSMTLFSDPVDLGTTTADASGAVNTTVTIPTSVPAGDHTLELRGPESGLVLTTSVTVTEAAPDSGPGSVGNTPAGGQPASSGGERSLAVTGAATLGLLLAAAVAIGGGTMLLGAKRASARQSSGE